ncbi:hypothetical protein NBH00_05380 [Paraconexibacter antarcticus]|uniref:Uncharacterized protein n=1 Tax=Paraconexibacter antarcticus TaxID=2949664 RepID=A0ABY5DXQ2_9ACTN|nr:hypothetical protein [Paraconexibacter antarcticus]UTI65642.1 hypothetical protein NBH00_05380 [Paraconexibacter antarcticus]
MTTPAGPTPPRPSRRERTRRIRRLAVTWTVVAFAAVWGVIYVQMRDGKDPALGTGVTNAAATTSAPAGAPAYVDPGEGYVDPGGGYVAPNDQYGGGPGYDDGGGAVQQGGGGGVTTRQS